MHLKPPPEKPKVLTPMARTPNITPPSEQRGQFSIVSEDSQSDNERSDSPEKKPFDFVAFSQGLLGVVQSNTQRCEGLGFQQKKTSLDIESFKIHLADLKKEYQNLIKRLEANEELCSMLDEDQKKIVAEQKKLNFIPEKQPESLISRPPSATQRSNSAPTGAVRLKKQLWENKSQTNQNNPIVYNRERDEELTAISKLNALGNPEKIDADYPSRLPESRSKIELLQQQVLQITSEIGELSNKAKTYEERSKNLDLDQLILKKISSLGLSNFSESIALQEESATLKEEAEKRNLERIARLERTVFFQWIGGGILTLLLWLKIQRK